LDRQIIVDRLLALDGQITENLGLPSTSPCFFCHPAHESIQLKEFLNMLLRSYNKERANSTVNPWYKCVISWWKCVDDMYQRLRNYEKIQKHPGIPRYISAEKQQWLTLYFASALDCDFPILEALTVYWPALRIAKRDIHDHLCSHKTYPIKEPPYSNVGATTTNIIPWATSVEILF